MSALSLDLAEGADRVRGRAALEAADAGPVRESSALLQVGPVSPAADGSYVARTSLGTLRADSLTSMLATGLVPRHGSGPAAAGWLWAGVPFVPVVAGVRRERAVMSEPIPTSVTVADVEHAWRDLALEHPRLDDGSLASRALAGGSTAASTVRVFWGTPASPAGPSPDWLEASTLDVARRFDEFVATSDVPTVAGFEADVLDALAERAGRERIVCAAGGDALFAAGDEARRAAQRPRPRFLRRRFRPAADSLDVDAARAAEIAGLEGAPIHRASSICAVLPTQTRDAVARFGPREAPHALVHDGGVVSIWSALATLDLDAPALARPAGTRLVRPFANPRVRALVEGLPSALRFGRPGSGGALARLAAASPFDGITARIDPRARGAGSFDSFLDTALRGPLASRLDAAMTAAASSPAFRADGVTTALARFRAGTHGWTARRIATIAFLALFLARERLTEEVPR